MGTITKALELLNLFSRAQPALGLKDVVRLTGRDKATIHRHLVELAANGFLEQDTATRAYRLGPAVLRLAAVREVTSPTRATVLPMVEALAENLGELVHFSLLENSTLSPTCHADPARHGTQVHFDEAEVLPLHATSSGLAVLAFSTAEFQDAVLSKPLQSYTAMTVTAPDQVKALIAQAAATGIGSVDQAFDQEVSSRAAPIFGPTGRPIGAIAIAIPKSRANDQTISLHNAALKDIAPKITRALGGALPVGFPI